MRQNLLTDAQLGNDSTVTLDVLSHQIVQHLAALTDHLQQATTGVVVLLVDLQVLGQLVDASGQNGDLNLGRTGVSGVSAVGSITAVFSSLRIMGISTFLIILPKELRNGRVKPCPLGQAVPRNEADGARDFTLGYYITFFPVCKEKSHLFLNFSALLNILYV
mgnify:CR=1 FL=1